MNPVIAFNSKVVCKSCTLLGICLSTGLSGPDLAKLERIVKRTRPLHRGDLLFSTHSPFTSLFVVKTGSIKTVRQNPDGSEQVLGFHLPGEFIGFDAIQEDSYTCDAEVLETTAVCELPFDQLSELSQLIPDLQHQLFRLLSKEIADESKMLSLLNRKNAEERLAAFLTGLSCRFQRRGFSPTDFYLSMSRSEIGNYLGLAVETISRLLSRFQEDGLLIVNRKHIRLLNLERLHYLAGNDTRVQRKGQQQAAGK
ncbi:MAG: fumarate/nitrate reduction transcriptional regulator Fnr [Gammaproteobacteria bacterium SHHR-1]|uniref:fumarate/nitrate reduction transcriptional regulator Fnr n=1 Tax=Magnetovirga frankeli TaxID=947516 RepID=UPI001293147C|nr:fumarate/nitrate reduction transcriptional regulator Fnr [gamma proteobacterium SS-5]